MSMSQLIFLRIDSTGYRSDVPRNSLISIVIAYKKPPEQSIWVVNFKGD